MTETNLYELRGVRKIVESGKVILDIGCLDVPEGSVSAVVGPNGAGKSTLLKTLAFLEKPDQGEIRFRGKTVEPRDFLEIRRGVTMVDQSPLLFQGTVFKNVAYGLKVRGVPTEAWEKRVEDALSLVDLAGFAGRSVGGLSGGETQRVAIARALVFRPQVILLDEPAAGVDAARVEMLETLLREMIEKTGTSVVFSTHNLAQAYRLSGTVVHMAAGKTVRNGLENLFSGHAETREGSALVRLRCGTLVALTGDRSGPVRFTIPSSDIEIIPLSDNGHGPNRFEGSITRMEIRGTRVRMRLSGDLNLRVEMPPQRMQALGLKLGDRVAAVVPPQAVQVLES